MNPDPMMMLTAGRLRELHEDARRRTLVRIATCCRPSALRAALSRLSRAGRVCCA